MYYAGISKMDITPPVGYILSGHMGRDKPSQKVHDNLYLKVLTVFNGKERVVIVTSDLLSFTQEFVDKVREDVRKKINISAENLLLTASHTHTGPMMRQVSYHTEKPLDDYLSLLQKKIVGGIIEAINSEEKVELKYGKSEVNISINRRKKTPEGVTMLPNPEGPIDPEVNVFIVNQENGDPKAILFNYACHPSTLSVKIFQISADYPGVAQRELERAYPTAIAMFTNGCGGDIKPAVIEGDKFKAGDFNDIERIGRILAAEVIQVCERAEKIPEGDIKVILKKVNLPLNKSLLPVNEEKLKEVCSLYCPKGDGGIVFKKWKNYWEEKIKSGDKVPDFVESEIQVIKIGDINIVGLNGEILVEIGLKIKKRANKKLIICGYSNGYIGYIPTSIALKEGGYEPKAFFLHMHPAPYAEEVEEVLINSVLELL